MLLVSCKARSPLPEPIEPDTATGKPWYYLSSRGIHAAPSPRSIPAKPFVPWTEAVRVSDVAILPDGPVFLINRLGVMAPGSEDIPPVLAEDPDFFAGQTAAGFVLTGEFTAIHRYRNSFFSETAGKISDDYLIRYSPITSTFSPLSRISNLGLPPDSQCAGLEHAGNRWYAAFKVQRENRVEFVYRTFTTLPPEQDTDPDGSRTLEATEYQQAVMPEPYGTLPENVRSLLFGIPDETPLSIRLYPSGTGTTRTYVRNGDGNYREGYAFVNGSDTVATAYTGGSIPKNLRMMPSVMLGGRPSTSMGGGVVTRAWKKAVPSGTMRRRSFGRPRQN